jgi:DNA-nicking Smr family endonuclease
VTKHARRRSAHASPHNDASDAEAFERAMADVVRLGPDPRGRIRRAPPVTPTRPVAATNNDASESDHEYAAAGVDRRELRKLKRGAYRVGDWRDLHGMTTAEACAKVREFIENSRHRRYRCVCIVHGRGLHSDGNASVLKARVRECLRHHRSVLAYSDAPRSDGGPGAVYVLLRTTLG